jgi:hypothetical protein
VGTIKESVSRISECDITDFNERLSSAIGPIDIEKEGAQFNNFYAI